MIAAVGREEGYPCDLEVFELILLTKPLPSLTTVLKSELLLYYSREGWAVKVQDSRRGERPGGGRTKGNFKK